MNTINAPKGMWLTQANPDTPAQDRIFVTSVSGYGDIEGLYRLASEDEKAAVEAEQQALSQQAQTQTEEEP